jgi:hypothetical protein
MRLRFVLLIPVVVLTLLFVWPTMYIYGKGEGDNFYRVNRFTGVTQHATQYGWMTRQEESKLALAQAERDQAKDRQELLAAAARGEIAEASYASGNFEVTYRDGTGRQYMFWPNTAGPVLQGLRNAHVSLTENGAWR